MYATDAVSKLYPPTGNPATFPDGAQAAAGLCGVLRGTANPGLGAMMIEGCGDLKVRGYLGPFKNGTGFALPIPADFTENNVRAFMIEFEKNQTDGKLLAKNDLNSIGPFANVDAVGFDFTGCPASWNGTTADKDKDSKGEKLGGATSSSIAMAALSVVALAAVATF